MTARWLAAIIGDAGNCSYREARRGLTSAGSSGVMSLRALLRRLLPLKCEAVHPSHAVWHEIDPPLYRSVELIDGRRSQQTGRLWRRRTAAGTWEYRQDPESYDDFLDRQW